MPRRAEIAPRSPEPDPVYSSQLVQQLVNRVMTDGKKSVAEHIVYTALENIGTKTGRPPVEVLEQAVGDALGLLRRAAGAAELEVGVEHQQVQRHAGRRGVLGQAEPVPAPHGGGDEDQIGRASCRERVYSNV